MCVLLFLPLFLLFFGDTASTVTLKDVLPLCLATAVNLSGMDSGGIYLVNKMTGDLDLAFNSGLSDEFVNETSCIKADSDSARVVEAGRPIYSQHLILGVPITGVRAQEKLRAIAIIPILSKNRVIGCFNIASHKLDTVPDESRATLEAIAALIGNGIGRFIAEESLRQANKKLSLLSSITRHDIKNKLMVINGCFSLLKHEQPDLLLNENIRMISSAAQRISDIIRFTKEYEQIGITAPFWQNPYKLVDKAVKQVLPGHVKVKNDLHLYAEVLGDLLTGEVFYNLLDNAVRHGGKITTIRFFMQESGTNLLILIEDDGDGVQTDEKMGIFERGVGKNSGLGLTLAKEILEITGMTIQETGEPGKGARFEITVPKGTWRKNPVSPGT